jgi:hypothetical protein
MKSKNNEDYEPEEEGSDHSEDTTLDTKDFKCKSKVDSLTELKVNMERLKQPPPEWNFAYSMRVGLNGARTNLHKLKAKRDVLQKKLVETFGRMNFCSRF